jgi:hypothetical protein
MVLWWKIPPAPGSQTYFVTGDQNDEQNPHGVLFSAIREAVSQEQEIVRETATLQTIYNAAPTVCAFYI